MPRARASCARGVLAPGRSGREAGFTLIEIIVVLVVLGLVAGLVLTRGPMRSGAVDMRAAASQLIGALRLARARAIATNRPLDISFAPGQAEFQVADQPIGRLPGGIRLAAAPRAIRFRPDGSSSGGVVQLAGEAQSARIEVSWLTGRAALVAP